MPTPQTYSFADVDVALVGPGAFIDNLGAGSGAAEEGIDIEPVEDFDEMTIGADGLGMHSLKQTKGGKVTIRLLKTSPYNQKLSEMMAFQRISSANHGQNTLTIRNRVSGDVTTCQFSAFAKVPTIKYGKVGEMIEWNFNSILVDVALGAGVQA